MKIGLMGGTFDPVHNAHIKAALYVMEKIALDKVIFIPTFASPFKMTQKTASAFDRYNMLLLATQDYDFFEVSDYEIKSGGISYTYNTVEHFKSIFKDDELYFIMGDEAYAQFDKWKNPEIIRKYAKICVVTRDFSVCDDDAIFIDITPMHISSTQIRESLKDGETREEFLCSKVYDYIKKHNLYKG